MRSVLITSFLLFQIFQNFQSIMTSAMGKDRIILMLMFVYSLATVFLLLESNRISVLNVTHLSNPSPKIEYGKKIARGGFRENKRKVDLLIIVLSASSNFLRRFSIRQTWWKSCKKNSKVFPVLSDALAFSDKSICENL